MILKLKNIRVFSQYEIDFSNNTTILTGENSSGKSTIIEALYYCCFFKSPRTNKINEMLKFETEDSYISLTNNNSLKINFQKNKSSVSFNNKILNKKEAINKFNCILINPEQIDVINKGPSIRRNFINRQLSQIDKIFLNDQVSYNQLVKQKNLLLKENNITELYDVLTEQINQVNELLVNRKTEYICELEESANKVLKWITNTKEEIKLEYKIYKQTNIKEKEFKYKSCQFGNHLDDIDIQLNGISLKKYGSQGQKRTVIISLLIGHMDLMYKKTNKYPMVLMDDIHAELDQKRQEKLFNLLSQKTKTVIATPNINNISKLIVNSNKIKIVNIDKK